MGNRNRMTGERRSPYEILVIGDIMLDQYMLSRETGLCRKVHASMPEPDGIICCLGGAAGVAANIRSTGGKVTLAGVVGKDEEGEKIRKILIRKSIPAILGMGDSWCTSGNLWDTAGELSPVSRDGGGTQNFSSGIFHDVLRLVTLIAEDIRLVMILDYERGVVSEGLLCAVREFCESGEIPVLIGTSGKDLSGYRGNDVIRLDFTDTQAVFLAGLSMGISMGLPRETACKMADELVLKTVRKGISCSEGNFPDAEDSFGKVGARTAKAEDWRRIVERVLSGESVNCSG